MKTFEIDNFLTPLLYSFNEGGDNIPVVIADYPCLKFRENLAKSIPKLKLIEIFNDYVQEYKNGNKNFDP